MKHLPPELWFQDPRGKRRATAVELSKMEKTLERISMSSSVGILMLGTRRSGWGCDIASDRNSGVRGFGAKNMALAVENAYKLFSK